MMKLLSCAFFGVALLTNGCGPSSESKTRALETKAGVVQPQDQRSKEEALNYRLEWNRKTLVGDYERYGSQSAKWDEPAKLALESCAQLRARGDEARVVELPKLINATKTACSNGCDDPLIKYFYARFILPEEEHDSQQHAEAFRPVAEALSRTQRASIRKYYAALRAAEFSNVGAVNVMPEVQRWREEARQFLVEVTQDKTTPAGEVYDAWNAYFLALPKKSNQRYDLYLKWEPTLFKNWPAESSLYLLKGWVYCEYAWEARGTAVADAVTSQGWQGFAKRL